jgi:hypothetical protein
VKEEEEEVEREKLMGQFVAEFKKEKIVTEFCCLL